jgi:hypothetical protein
MYVQLTGTTENHSVSLQNQKAGMGMYDLKKGQNKDKNQDRNPIAKV